MSNATNMSAPVTRGEMRTEIARLESKFDREFVALRAELEKFATKADLDKFATKADLAELKAELKAEFKAELKNFATKADLDLWGGALLERMAVEIARHVNAALESVSAQISAIDDKYADLPGRVQRLEASLPPSKRR